MCWEFGARTPFVCPQIRKTTPVGRPQTVMGAVFSKPVSKRLAYQFHIGRVDLDAKWAMN
jgi:hypothetical protein